MSIEITTPFPVFADVSGKPLEDGYIYIGVPNADPVTGPSNVYWDASLSTLATQPIRTKGGLPVRSPGVTGRLFINGQYSITVKNKNGFTIFTLPQAVDYITDATVNTIAELRAFPVPTIDGFPISVKGYYSIGDGGGGPDRYWASGAAPATYVDNGGSIIVPTGGDGSAAWLFSCSELNSRWFGCKGDGATNDTTAMQKAINAAYTMRAKLVISGRSVISSTLSVQAGQNISGIAGAETANLKSALIGVGGITVIDLSGLKWGKFESIHIDAASASVGIYAKNVYGMVIRDVRVTGASSIGISVENDGAGTGCYNNTFDRVAVDTCPTGIQLYANGQAINRTVFRDLIVTDCEDYGVKETGGTSSRNTSFYSPDIEKCGVGIQIQSWNFLIAGGYFEWNGKDVFTTKPGVVRAQGGTIQTCSFLGAYLFPDIVSKDTINVDINAGEDIVVKDCWFAYAKVGVQISSTSRNIRIESPFYNDSNVETFIQDFGAISVDKGSSGNQTFKQIKSFASNYVMTGSENILYVDLGNLAYTLTLDISLYKDGFGFQLLALGNSGQTGTVTISDSTGAAFVGQNKVNRIFGVTSFTVGPRSNLEFRRINSTTWLVMSSE